MISLQERNLVRIQDQKRTLVRIQDPTFCHKVSREASVLEEALVLEGVVQLPVRHAAALKPAVEDVLHAAQHAPALAAGDGQVVDVVPVQVRDL